MPAIDPKLVLALALLAFLSMTYGILLIRRTKKDRKK